MQNLLYFLLAPPSSLCVNVLQGSLLFAVCTRLLSGVPLSHRRVAGGKVTERR